MTDDLQHIHDQEPLLNLCALCGRQYSGLEGDVAGVPFCHPDFGQDCYHLVTVYGRYVPGHGVWTPRGWVAPSVEEP